MTIKTNHPLDAAILQLVSRERATKIKIHYKDIEANRPELIAEQIASAHQRIRALLKACRRQPILMKRIKMLERLANESQACLQKNCASLIEQAAKELAVS